MRGNYKVRVRVPIYATAVIEQAIIGAESEAAAIAQAQEATDEVDVGFWFSHYWKPWNKPLPSLAEIIEFESTEVNEEKGTTE